MASFRKRVAAMGITEVITAPRSPWQNACVERAIGSIRRECLDHIVIFNERHLRRVLSSYVDYYQRTRTHLSLDKDCPDLRPDPTTQDRKSRRHPESRWPASPLRTARLKEEGCCAVDQQESVRAKSAHSTLDGARKKMQILQFVGFSVWHPDCGSALH
jgi:Integrase core domain